MTVTCTELKPGDWEPLERLFGPSGAQAGCWCMWWRVERGGKQWEEMQGEPGRREFRRRVRAGQVRGILAWDGKRAVGWATFGPRREFPRLETVKAFRVDDPDAVWSIPCFFVHRDYRGQGLTRILLAAVMASARSLGAKLLEAYPVTATAMGGKVASAFAYTGPMKIFLDAGFRELQRLSPTRPLVRLRLRRR